jgi:hypothetical protein
MAHNQPSPQEQEANFDYLVRRQFSAALPEGCETGHMSVGSWPSPSDGWPEGFWAVPYVGSASPGRAAPGSWLNGANCQLFAYGMLGLFGIDCPPLPSTRLWRDCRATVAVQQPEPLDIALFNATPDPFGAHLGVWMAPDEIVHLCKEVGHPVVWPRGEFSRRARYATVIGFKRVVAR